MTSLCVLFLAVTADPPPAPAVKEPALRDELKKRVKADQDARFQIVKPNGAAPSPAELDALEKIDDENRAWLKGVVEKHGWPGKTLVGVAGAHDAWLLVQHADADRPFQKKCLDLLTAAVKAGEATGTDLAYLTDRVRAADGKKQLYGTQLEFKDGRLIPKPIEDEAGLDARRKDVGMPPMAEYLKRAAEMYKVKENPPVKK